MDTVPEVTSVHLMGSVACIIAEGKVYLWGPESKVELLMSALSCPLVVNEPLIVLEPSVGSRHSIQGVK